MPKEKVEPRLENGEGRGVSPKMDMSLGPDVPEVLAEESTAVDVAR